MPKISEKPCDFIVEETPSLKFYIIPPPFSPSGGGHGGGRPLCLCGGLNCYNKRRCQKQKLLTFLDDSATERLDWPCTVLENRSKSVYL